MFTTKPDPIQGVYTFRTHFNIPEVNVSTSPIGRSEIQVFVLRKPSNL